MSDGNPLEPDEDAERDGHYGMSRNFHDDDDAPSSNVEKAEPKPPVVETLNEYLSPAAAAFVQRSVWGRLYREPPEWSVDDDQGLEGLHCGL